jgi:hypothetical protein
MRSPSFARAAGGPSLDQFALIGDPVVPGPQGYPGK